jgi:Na+-transporting NADH:ubiquinone oxidoreductase subunit NqrA|tara:strand:- start:86 stop:490 length:405 start_codon:yes stop_codon:yes gene_type:complete
MPLTPKGKKIQAAMKKQYGSKKGVQVFNATANSGKIKKVKRNKTRLSQGGAVKKAPSAGAKKKQTRTLKLAPGGAAKSKSRVNEAGNYTKPGLRKRIFNRIKAGGKGGAPGQWSARKAQMTAAAYKKAGGGYRN